MKKKKLVYNVNSWKIETLTWGQQIKGITMIHVNFIKFGVIFQDFATFQDTWIET